MGKNFFRALAVILAVPVVLLSSGSVSAEGTSVIRLVSSNVTSEFPEGIRFRANVETDVELESIAVRFRVGQRNRGVYEYLDMTKRELVNSELFLRTNTAGTYIPPGTIIRYNYEILDVEGNRIETERMEFIYEDPRFDWIEVSDGPVSVAYHGPVRTRAKSVLDAIVQTLGVMGPLLGADTEEPIRVAMYNNVKEMLEALPPGSTTIRRELITEGQAFTEDGTLLVLGGDTSARGTASHEVTHILIHRAGDSIFGRIPSWLGEGLAEFGNVEPSFSYEDAMDFMLWNDVLLPITSMSILPGNPEDVIAYYGQSRSLIRWMIDRFGPGDMRGLMTLLKDGASMDDALQEVYGYDRTGLENEWRRDLGATTLIRTERVRVRPTAIPRPDLQLYTLTPQPSAPAVASSELDQTATPEPPAPAIEDEEEPTSGGGCNAPLHGGPVAADISVVGLLVGLVGLGLRRRK